MKWLKAFAVFLFLGCLVSGTSNNFEPIGVQYNESFNACNITARNDSGTLIANQVFTFPATTNVVVYMTNLTSWYGERYNYSVKINHTVNGWMEVYNDTWGFLGRGTIETSNLLIAVPSSGDTTHLSTAAQIYTYVNGQGFLTAEADPVALAKFGTLTAGKYCKSDGTQVICTYTVPDAYDDSGLWTNASGQQTSLNNLWTNASSQETRMTGIDDAWKANGSAAATHITNLWTNASIQEGKITALITNTTNTNVALANIWSNASSQEVRMQGIDDAWKANGSAASTHITNLWSNASSQEARMQTIQTNQTATAVHVTNLWTNASIQEAAIAAKLPFAGGTLTGNLTYATNTAACFGSTCQGCVFYDGTYLVLQIPCVR